MRLLLVSILLALAAASQAATVASRFDTDADGWKVADIAGLPGAGAAANWDAVGQGLQTVDVANWTTFSAPAKFLGNASAYYGGTLAFDLQDTQKDASADTVATFGIASGATVLFWFGGSPSTVAMTSFSAGLDVNDARWRLGGSPVDAASGAAPTAQQFQAVLAGVTALRINADWKDGADDSRLDNVVLATSVPEPGSWALMAAGLAMLGARRGRRG